MDDIRTDFVAVLVNIVHVELLRQQGVPLDGNHGILFAVYVPGVDVHLRPVESGLAHILHKGNAQLAEHAPDSSFRLLPDLRFADIFLTVFRVPFGQMIGDVLLQPQGLQAVLGQGDAALELLHHLIRPDDQVSLGDGELPYPGKSVHLPGILVAEQRGSLAVAAGQVAVGLLAVLEHIVLEGAGHGAQGEDFSVFLLVPQHEHALFVMIPVA